MTGHTEQPAAARGQDRKNVVTIVALPLLVAVLLVLAYTCDLSGAPPGLLDAEAFANKLEVANAFTAALDTTAHLATRGTHLVTDSAGDFDVTVRAMARILRTVHADRDRIPSMFDAVGAFFDMLGAGMRLPGPDGKKLTALKGFITIDLCMVYGVCVLPEGGLGATTTPPLVGGGGAPAPGGGGAPSPGGGGGGGGGAPAPGGGGSPLGPILDTLLGPLGGNR